MPVYYFKDKDSPAERLGSIQIKEGTICTYKYLDDLRVEVYIAQRWHRVFGDLNVYMKTRLLIEGISLD